MEVKTMPSSVTVVEVAARDGLQSEPNFVDTQTKVDFIDRLACAGFRAIELTSFANPRRVPQFADAQALCARIQKRAGVRYIALVPNMQALQRAVAAGISDVAVLSAASDSFNQHNIGCTTAESLRRLEPILAFCDEHGIGVRAYISCALGCPFELDVDAAKVAELAANLQAMGCAEIVLADTIGAGTVRAVQRLIECVSRQVAMSRIAVHFHNTRGQALANILACLELGVTTIDASVAGLGGCPFAPGASGNVASEDLLYMLYGLGIETGIDLAKVVSIGRDISARLRRPNESAMGRANPYETHSDSATSRCSPGARTL